MQLYAGTSKDFIADSTRNAIAGKLERAFHDAYHYKPARQEVQSWQNSLLQMSTALTAGNLLDHGILLEFQLPLTSSRLDCMITGHSPGGVANSVIVELKQWSKVEPSNAEGCVVSWVGGQLKDVHHPSRQVGQYAQYLNDMLPVFTSGSVKLRSCAYLHNLNYDPADEIFSPRHAALLANSPTFAGDQQDKLIEFLNQHVGEGNGAPVLDAVVQSRFAPSKKLLEHTSQVVEDQQVYVLLDSQDVVFNKVLAEVQAASEKRKIKKTVVLVHGGPGTGKSVVALHLLGRLSKSGKSVMHLTGSAAFTENMRKVVGARAAAQFSYFNMNSKGQLPPNQFDALILDEAHRIRENSKNQWTKASDWSGLPQIEEVMNIAKVSVFFIDDRQVVRPKEVGSSDLIRTAAKKFDAELLEYELDAQFRCAGSDGFINWVDNTLAIRKTANVLWSRKDPYDFQIVDSIEELDAEIRAKADAGFTARMTAGFCWPWSDPNGDGTLVSDVKVGDWEKPWNAKGDKGRLAADIPRSNFWASQAGGIEQVGCIYTAQGFEFDYAGIIFGLDLRYDWDQQTWVGDKTHSHDSVVKRSGDKFAALVKNTYRVLFTRGMKGCRVYFMDEGTKRFFQSRFQSVDQAD